MFVFQRECKTVDDTIISTLHGRGVPPEDFE
jgi:hypothetical protein